MSVKSIWPQIVGQAWADETFRERLIADPRGTLAEFGITLSDGQEVEILTDTPEKTYLVLPPKPVDLDDLAGTAIHTVFGQCTGAEFIIGTCTCAEYPDLEPGQCTGDEHRHHRHHHHRHHHKHEHPSQCTVFVCEEGTCTCHEMEPGTCTCATPDVMEPGTCTCATPDVVEPGTCTCAAPDVEPGTCTCAAPAEPGTCTCQHHDPDEEPGTCTCQGGREARKKY